MFAQGPVLAASSNSFGGGGVAGGLGCFLGNSGGVSAFTVKYVSGTGSPTSPGSPNSFISGSPTAVLG